MNFLSLSMFFCLATMLSATTEPAMDGVERTAAESAPAQTVAPRRMDVRPDRPDWEYSADAWTRAVREMDRYLGRKYSGVSQKSQVYYHNKYQISAVKNVTPKQLNDPLPTAGQFYQPQQAVIAVFLFEVKITRTVATMSNQMELLQRLAASGQTAPDMPAQGQSESADKVFLISLPMVPMPMNLGMAGNPQMAQMMAQMGGATGVDMSGPQIPQELLRLKMFFPSDRVKVKSVSSSELEALARGEIPGSSESTEE